MSLFKKKEEIPIIPPIPPIPPIENFNLEVGKKSSGLPTLTGDARNETNRDAIKSAIEDTPEEKNGDAIGPANGPTNFEESVSLPIIPVIVKYPKEDLPKLDFQKEDSSDSEIPEFKKSTPIPPKPILINQFGPSEEMEKVIKKDVNESIFVRIDKFNSAKRDIKEIERDLKRIEEVLEEINEIKVKEDEEVNSLSKNLEEIKERLSKIDTEIFNRI